MANKRGAPPGGRVHWLLFCLPNEFKQAYQIEYDYARHNYTFYRMNGKELYDVFIVVQTSLHYWHVTYANLDTHQYEYFGDCKTSHLAKRMWILWRADERRLGGAL